MKRILVLSVAAVTSIPFAAAFVTGRLGAQQPALPQFEAVSIKPSASNSTGAMAIGRTVNPRMVRLSGITTKDLIARAYSLKRYQIIGPAWLDEERYDIIARAERPAPESEQRLMLQSMLADRFQMAAHIDTKDLPSYELVVGKNGPKLQEAKPDEQGSRFFPNAPGISGRQVSMSQLADLLSAKLDRPVADKTGLPGAFDIELKWSPETAPPDIDLGPSVFTAVQEQLGLRMQGRKSPLKVLVIDRIARPSAN